MPAWLVKSEPEEFSFSDLERSPARTTTWEGVRNYLARNHLQEMRRGDTVLFYHSGANPPHVAGFAEVAAEARPDPTAFDARSRYHDPRSNPGEPRWVMVELRAVRALEAPVTLQELKENPRLAGMKVVQKGQRASVLPVTDEELEEVLRMAREKAAASA
jgi:predicted RNA-binding protein with PUA-like domain